MANYKKTAEPDAPFRVDSIERNGIAGVTIRVLSFNEDLIDADKAGKAEVENAVAGVLDEFSKKQLTTLTTCRAKLQAHRAEIIKTQVLIDSLGPKLRDAIKGDTDPSTIEKELDEARQRLTNLKARTVTIQEAVNDAHTAASRALTGELKATADGMQNVATARMDGLKLELAKAIRPILLKFVATQFMLSASLDALRRVTEDVRKTVDDAERIEKPVEQKAAEPVQLVGFIPEKNRIGVSPAV